MYVTGRVRDRESHAADLDDPDPITRFARALEESAIERLAVDQRPLPSGPRHETRAEIGRPNPSDDRRSRLRLIEQQRIALRKTRAVAETNLRRAGRDRSRLGLLARGRCRDELASEMALQEATLRMVDRKLRELDRHVAAARRSSPDAGVPCALDREKRSLRTSVPALHAEVGVDLEI